MSVTYVGDIKDETLEGVVSAFKYFALSKTF